LKKAGFFTDEGNTRLRSTLEWAKWFGVGTLGAALLAGYLIFQYYSKPNLPPMQHICWPQYWTSFYRSYLPFPLSSRYDYVMAVVREPATGRELRIPVGDDYIEPVFDMQGRVKKQGPYVAFQAKPDFKTKELFWTNEVTRDTVAYERLRRAIYNDKSLPIVFTEVWLFPLLIWLGGTAFLTWWYWESQQRYIAGDQLRGTRELSPQEYEKEHRDHTGYGIKVYPQETKR
jgi:hypothetical protein